MASSTVERFVNLFKHKSASVIGMIHLRALPGTPCSNHSVQEIVDLACHEATLYRDAGLDGVIVENMHDVPFLHTDAVGPEITATMSVVCSEVKKIFAPKPVGVQVLAGANRQALAVAKAAGLQFVRAEGFVFAHVADEGMMNACAGELMRYRRHIGADDVLVFADIKKKHSAHAITADVDIVETAKAAQFFLADGVVITGAATGQVTSTKEVKAVLENVKMPILVGSGVTADNVDQYRAAHAVIVGSFFKKDGYWANPIQPERVHHFMTCVHEVRAKQVVSTMIM